MNLLLLRPLDTSHPINQRFGEHPENYPLTHGHPGIDYDAREGTPVRAAADGTVVFADIDPETVKNPKAGYGFNIRIKHDDTTLTLYGHFRQDGLQVAVKQQVRMGDFIGLSGNTGHTTGPHLHFELRLGTSLSNPVDPAPFIVDEMPVEGGLFNVIMAEGHGENIRGGPDTKRPVLGFLKSGERFKVFNLAGSDTWLDVQQGFVKFDPTFFSIQKPSVEGGLLDVVLGPDIDMLRLRSSPQIDPDNIKRRLNPGERLTVFKLAGKDVWLRGQQGFIFLDTKLLTIELIPLPPPPAPPEQPEQAKPAEQPVEHAEHVQTQPQHKSIPI